ncbi:MAG: DUF1854 domain-containing protein [Oscillospiraceae bacterium]|nr:DUF1854 domain-containing protein [Oscillospiraceae bacterium]
MAEEKKTAGCNQNGSAKTADKKEDAKPAEKDPGEAKPENTKPEETKAAADDDEENIEDLFIPRRVSIPLTKENARFFRSQGGLISLDFTNHKGEKEIVERVVVYRAFPITNPDEFLSVREPDSKKEGRGLEIGMIRHLSDMSEESREVITEELTRRYFSPTITKIRNVKEKFGYSYWDADTTSGPVTFIMSNPFQNIRVLEDGRIFMRDMDGNNFQIPDSKSLDPASYKKIEVYL